MYKILVTGASGFVGQHLIKELKLQNFYVVCLGRNRPLSFHDEFYSVSNSNDVNSWQKALIGCDVVVHLAARTHVMTERSANPLDEFRKVNVECTEHLAELATRAGVKRFVYVSSVKVNGEQTIRPFTELDDPNPQDAYGLSKYETELALHKVSAETSMEMVIVRPPLVYGPGVKGNFLQMIKVIAKGIPLPFASVKNLRSLIYVGNLVDALILCSTHSKAVGQTYLVSDMQDISTPDLLRKLSNAMDIHAKILPCSPIAMRLVGQLFGKSEQLEKLVGSLQVDISKIRRELGWKPPFTLDEGLQATVSERQ